MNSLLISVIVPIYNIENYLDDCIISILNQSYYNFELILVDDGSTDSCSQICDKYSLIDKRISVIHKKNGGLVSARNEGVKYSKGQYITYVDGDDWVSENWLICILQAINDYHPDLISYNAYKSTDGKNIPMNTSSFSGFFNEKGIKECIIPNMLFDSRFKFYSFGILPSVWSKAFRRDILIRNLCRDESITFGEDAACVYSYLLECNSYISLPDYLYYYRQNNGAMTKAYDKNRFSRINILFEYLNNSIIKKNSSLTKQFEMYKLFCISYAILNEAKIDSSSKLVARKNFCLMEDYGFQKFVNEVKINNCTLIWQFFFGLVRHKKYCLLAFLCNILIRIKYSYKT